MNVFLRISLVKRDILSKYHSEEFTEMYRTSSSRRESGRTWVSRHGGKRQGKSVLTNGSRLLPVSHFSALFY